MLQQQYSTRNVSIIKNSFKSRNDYFVHYTLYGKLPRNNRSGLYYFYWPQLEAVGKFFIFFFFRFISLIAGLSCLVLDLSNRIQFTSLSELAYCFISSTRESFSWVNCLTWSSSSSSSSSWSTVLGIPPLNVYSINFRRKRSNYERKHSNSIESRCSVKKVLKTR